MSSTSHVNHYRKRLVAQANEKSCTVCYRPTNVVLMSVDSKDWFYVCAQHLKDPGFASQIVDQAAEKERLKQIEIAKVKAEYEAKQKRKQAEKDQQDKEKDNDKEKDKSKGGLSSWIPNPFSSSSAADKKTETAADKNSETAPAAAAPVEVKEFALHRTVYNHRVSLKQQAAQQKARDAQWATLQFPSVPGK